MRRISLEDFTKLVGKKLVPAVADAAVRALRSSAARGVGVVVQEIDNAVPYPAVDRGMLRQSVTWHRIADGAELSVDAPHAPMIEYGTRPFTPPLEPLIVWAQRKGLASNEKEARRVARAVQRKISKLGIAPRHFFEKAMLRINNEIIPAELAHELQGVKL